VLPETVSVYCNTQSTKPTTFEPQQTHEHIHQFNSCFLGDLALAGCLKSEKENSRLINVENRAQNYHWKRKNACKLTKWSCRIHVLNTEFLYHSQRPSYNLDIILLMGKDFIHSWLAVTDVKEECLRKKVRKEKRKVS